MGTTNRTRRAAVVAAIALALAVAAPLVAAPSATAAQETTTSRLSGGNRFATAEAVALDAFADPAAVDTVVLAVGIKSADQPPAFPDALSASGIAGALGAPLLLTGVDNIPAPTQSALDHFEPTNVILVGGSEAISSNIETELTDAGYEVTRHEGTNRFETAAAVGQAIADTDDSNPLTEGDGLGTTESGVTAIVTDGLNFPDAVSASQLSFAGRFPILLVGTDAVPTPTETALTDLGIEHVLIVGGPNAVSTDVETAIEGMEITTERLAGTGDSAGRFGTSVAVAEYAAATLGFGGDTVYLATGLDFPDALGGGTIAGVNAAPLLLTGTSDTPAPIADHLEANALAIDNIVALGGTGVIDADSLTSAADAAQAASAQAYVFDPPGDQTETVSGHGLNDDGQVTFTVSGIAPEAEVVIAILDSEVVEDDGTITAYDLSDEGTTAIESVNGTQTFTAGSGNESVQATATADENGVITFTVDATEADSVHAVVFLDEDEDGDEETDELTLVDGTPVEAYGISGLVTWQAA